MFDKPVNSKSGLENTTDFIEKGKKSSLLMKSVKGIKSGAPTQKKIKMSY